jgi:hypothetical protein
LARELAPKLHSELDGASPFIGKEGDMQIHQNPDLRVLEVIAQSPGTALDDIVLECPDLTWNQVFIAIDRLSREGALKLTPKGRGLYTVHLSNDALQAARQQTII